MKYGIIINEASYEAVEDTKDNCQGGCSICEIRDSCVKLAFCPCIIFEQGFHNYHFELRK